MFDELEEKNGFEEITNFKSLIMQSILKKMKFLKSLHKAGAYLEPNRSSTIVSFCEYT